MWIGDFKLERRTQRTIEFYVGISPWLVGFALLVAGPLVSSLILSFSRWDIITTFRWVGFGNYVRMFTRDPLFWASIRATSLYSFSSVPLRLLMALFLAALLNQPLLGRNIFRTIYYLPAITSGVAVAILWEWMFQPEIGILNALLWLLFRIEGPKWIYSPGWAMPSFVVMSLWSLGSPVVIFLAALQEVPQHLYEAAEIDGAGAWSKFRGVTLPMISPAIFFNLIIGIISSFQIFTPAFVMTQGGPLNASLFMVLYLYYKAFQDFEMGYACGLAWVLFIIILILSLIQFRLSGKWVYYES